MKLFASWPRLLSRQAWVNAFSAALAFAYPQQPLYSSNQNTYLIHVAKKLPYYRLSGDWFASTVDPFPLFTNLTGLVVQAFGEQASHFIYICLLFIFVRSLFEMALLVMPSSERAGNTERSIIACSLALFLLFSSPYFLRLLIKLSPSFEKLLSIRSLLMDGLADQYIAGSIYQPSVFGILLIASLALWTKNKTFASVTLLGLAPLFHASYVVSSLLIFIGYAAYLLSRENGQKILKPALLYMFFLSMFLAMNSSRIFSGSTSDTMQLAQSILFDFRIPHHADPAKWLNRWSFVKYALMIIGVIIARRTSIFLPLLMLLASAIFGPFLIILLGSKSLALLFPWRSSVVLAPFTSLFILSLLIYRLLAFANSSLVSIKSVSVAMVFAAMLLGSYNFYNYLHAAKLVKESLSSAMRTDYTEGDVFLINPSLENARLKSGTPIYVDFKSHPYRPEELIEWKLRIENARNLYSSSLVDACPLAERALSSEGAWGNSGITAIVDVSEDGTPGSLLAGCKNLRVRSVVNGYSIYSTAGEVAQ